MTESCIESRCDIAKLITQPERSHPRHHVLPGNGGTPPPPGGGLGYLTLTALLLPNAFALGTTGVCSSSSSSSLLPSLPPGIEIQRRREGSGDLPPAVGRLVSEVSREWWDEAVEWVEWMLVFAVLESEDRSERGTGRGREMRRPLEGRGGEMTFGVLEKPDPGLTTDFCIRRWGRAISNRTPPPPATPVLPRHLAQPVLHHRRPVQPHLDLTPLGHPPLLLLLLLDTPCLVRTPYRLARPPVRLQQIRQQPLPIRLRRRPRQLRRNHLLRPHHFGVELVDQLGRLGVQSFVEERVEQHRRVAACDLAFFVQAPDVVVEGDDRVVRRGDGAGERGGAGVHGCGGGFEVGDDVRRGVAVGMDGVGSHAGWEGAGCVREKAAEWRWSCAASALEGGGC